MVVAEWNFMLACSAKQGVFKVPSKNRCWNQQWKGGTISKANKRGLVNDLGPVDDLPSC